MVSNLAHKMAAPAGPGDNGGDHTRSPAVFLNGVHPKRTDGADIQAGVTIDQIAAQKIGQETPLPSLELATEDYQRAGRLLRRRLQLRLHEHDFLAHAHYSDCRWRSIRA